MAVHNVLRILARGLCLVMLFGPAPLARAQTAHFGWLQSTVASGLSANNGDLEGVAVDGSGNVYYADSGNNQVLMATLQADGSYVQSTVANGPINGLDKPAGVAVDGAGHIYIADTWTGRVLMGTLAEYASNAQTTVANNAVNGISLPMGVALDGTGLVYIANSGQFGILVGTVQAYLNDTQTSVYVNGGRAFTFMEGIAVDGSGTIFAVDNSIRKVVSGTLSAFATSGQTLIGTGWGVPDGVAVDASGNLYIVDVSHNRLIKETLASGSYTQSILASGLNYPAGVAVDASGNVYVVDSGSGRVLKISPTGAFGPVAVGGTSPAATAVFTFDSAGTLGTPASSVSTQGVASLDFTAAAGSTIANGQTVTAGEVGTTAAVAATFSPQAAGPRYGAATLYNAGGAPIATAFLTGTGMGPQAVFPPGAPSTVRGSLHGPVGVAADGNGTVYYIDMNLGEAYRAPHGDSSLETPVRTGLGWATGVAVDGQGNVYFADGGNSAILKSTLKADGTYAQTQVAGGIDYAMSVAVDGSGNLYFVSQENAQVFKETLQVDGTYQLTMLGSGLHYASGVAADARGNVYAADSSHNRILKETLQGDGSYVQTTVRSGLYDPQGVAVDGNGNLYLADSNNSRVLMETLQGDGSYLETTLATGLNDPTSVAVDGSGNVYVAEFNGNRILKLDFADPPALAFTTNDAPRTVTVQNLGNADLVFASLSSLTDPFGLGASSTLPQLPGGILSANHSATLVVDFLPATTGSYSGTLTLTDNHLNQVSATQAISLSGTGHLTLTPATLSAGTAGTPYPVTFAASGGTGPYAYAVTSGALPAGVSLAAGVLSGAPTQVGSSTFSITATDANGSTCTLAYAVTVGQGTPTVTWATPSAITYGTALGATQLDASATNAAGASVAGTFTYNPSAGTVLAAGTHTLSVAFTPGDPTDYNTVTGQTVSLTVNPATPVVTWAAPAAIAYGTALSGTQLNASAPVAGTWTYNPPAGTVLAAGTHTLSVTFTPSDTSDYTTVTSQTATLLVNPVTVAVTWAAPAAVTYGTALSGTQLNASAPVAGAFTYNPPAGTVLNAGTQTLGVTFTPADPADYGSGSSQTVTLTVNPAQANVTLVNLVQPYTGLHCPVAATTDPASLAAGLTFTYDGGAEAPAAPGSHTVTATVHDPNYTGGATGTLVIGADTAPLILTAPDAAMAGQPVTFTATLTGGAGLPTGTVQFFDGTTLLGSAPFTSGTASWTTGALTAGSHVLGAAYGGDSLFAAASGALTLVVATGTPSLQARSSSPCALAGQAVTFTAQVAVATGTPTGTVSFLDGTTLLGSSALAAGVATFTTSGLAQGLHAITVAYGGDADSAPASTVLGQDIVLGASVTLTSTGTGTPAYGQAVTFTASVAGAGGGTPTGPMIFLSGGEVLGTAALDAGTATFTTMVLGAGSNAVTAFYPGDATYAAAVSATLTEVVSAPPAPQVTPDAGGTATTTFYLALQGKVGAPVTFAVAGLPPGWTCIINNQEAVTVTPGWLVMTLTFQAGAGQQARNGLRGARPADGLGAASLLGCGIFALPFCRRRKGAGPFLAGLLLVLLGGLTACLHQGAGQGAGTTAAAAGRYQVTVTASTPGAPSVSVQVLLTLP